MLFWTVVLAGLCFIYSSRVVYGGGLGVLVRPLGAPLVVVAEVAFLVFVAGVLVVLIEWAVVEDVVGF